MTALPASLAALVAQVARQRGTPYTPQAMRQAMAFLCTLAIPPEPVASCRDHLAGERVPVRVYHPDPATRPPLMVYCHGGGHMAGSVAAYDSCCRAIANRTGCVVASVDYRLAPEHPWPAGLEDALAATRWAAAQATRLGAGPDLFVAGDSAGGNLAARISQNLYRELAIQGTILIYPSLDYTLSQDSYRRYAQGYLLETGAIRYYFDNYLPGDVDRADPAVAPLRASLATDMPATLILAAEHDPLVDEGREYAERLATAGVPVTRREFAGMIHAFMCLHRLVPETVEELFREMAAFVQSQATAPGPAC